MEYLGPGRWCWVPCPWQARPSEIRSLRTFFSRCGLSSDFLFSFGSEEVGLWALIGRESWWIWLSKKPQELRLIPEVFEIHSQSTFCKGSSNRSFSFHYRHARRHSHVAEPYWPITIALSLVENIPHLTVIVLRQSLLLNRQGHVVHCYRSFESHSPLRIKLSLI